MVREISAAAIEWIYTHKVKLPRMAFTVMGHPIGKDGDLADRALAVHGCIAVSILNIVGLAFYLAAYHWTLEWGMEMRGSPWVHHLGFTGFALIYFLFMLVSAALFLDPNRERAFVLRLAATIVFGFFGMAIFATGFLNIMPRGMTVM